MTLELNRATFRRLVQLQLTPFAASILVLVVELLTQPFASFDQAFELLVVEHFGQPASDSIATTVGYMVFGAAVVWMVASSIGLLWFKRWARFGVWASLLLAVPVLLVTEGYRPSYTSPAGDWLAVIDAGLLGAILMLAYGRDHGTVWFARGSENMEQT